MRRSTTTQARKRSCQGRGRNTRRAVHRFPDKKDPIPGCLRSCRARPLGAAWGWVHAFVRGSLDPEVQRVILIDGPAVLGWDEWREIEAQYGLGAIEVALKTAIGAGPFDVSTAA
jgi:hypothetical protein